MPTEDNPVRLIVVPVDQLRAIIKDIIVEEVASLLDGARRPAPLLDRVGVAQALDVCADTVDKLRREGMPEIRVGDSPRFELPVVLEWLMRRTEARR